MKQIIKLQIARKILVLAFLTCGLIFTASVNEQQTFAVRCCIHCAHDGSVPYADIDARDFYCSNQCGGAMSGTCFNRCRNDINSCWSTCDTTCSTAPHCGFTGCPMGGYCDQNTGLCS